MSLTTTQLNKAVQYNTANAGKVGWLTSYGRVASLLELESLGSSAEDFARSVYGWQEGRNGLTPDGKLGPATWRQMQPHLPASNGASLPNWLRSPQSVLLEEIASEPLRVAGAGPLWLQIAQAERDHWDDAAASMSTAQRQAMEAHMTRDEAYFLASPYFGARIQSRGTMPRNDRRLDWCAAFVNWCLHRAGFSHTGNAGANSFLRNSLWRFRALAEPRQGCVVVTSHGQTGAHVAFLWDWSNLPSNPNGDVQIPGPGGRRSYRLLGGNQSNRITLMNDRRNLLAGRDMHGNRSPYLWPEHGEGTCNLIPPTEAQHFCGNHYPA